MLSPAATVWRMAGEALRRAGDLHHEVGSVDGALQTVSLGDRPPRVVGERRRHLDGHVAVGVARAVVDRPQQVAGLLHVGHDEGVDDRRRRPTVLGELAGSARRSVAQRRSPCSKIVGFVVMPATPCATRAPRPPDCREVAADEVEPHALARDPRGPRACCRRIPCPLPGRGSAPRLAAKTAAAGPPLAGRRPPFLPHYPRFSAALTRARAGGRRPAAARGASRRGASGRAGRRCRP